MFGKKPTMQEVAKAYASLTDEDKASFKQSIGDTVSESDVPQEKTETEAQQPTEAVIEQPAEAAEPTAGETAKTEPVEPDMPKEADMAESATALVEGGAVDDLAEIEKPQEQEKEDERSEALALRIDVLEDTITKLSQMVDAITSKSEDKAFGLSPKPGMGSGELSDDDRIMNNYYKKNPRAYK